MADIMTMVFNEINSMMGALQVEEICRNCLKIICNFDHGITVRVTKCNICNGAETMATIQIYIKNSFFFTLLRFISPFPRDINVSIFTLKKLIQVTEYNSGNGPFNGGYKNTMKVIFYIFALALEHRFQYINSSFFYI